MLPDRSTSTGPRRTPEASVLALPSRAVRQHLAVVGFSVGFAPMRPCLAATALVTTAGAPMTRLRGQVLCATKPSVLASV